MITKDQLSIGLKLYIDPTSLVNYTSEKIIDHCTVIDFNSYKDKILYITLRDVHGTPIKTAVLMYGDVSLYPYTEINLMNNILINLNKIEKKIKKNLK